MGVAKLQDISSNNPDPAISSTQEILEDVKAGRPVILIDDEDRENEGDLMVAADRVTPEVITFMIRKCGGFVCLPLAPQMADRLDLPLQPRRHVLDLQAPFTVSIEARHGVSTGVSADDRVKTIQAAIKVDAGPDDISTPGHIFPLRAQDNGVLDREGHTEACVDFARLAGFQPAAVLCEIMNDDGTMARLPDLVPFARDHGLKIGTIADLVAYRKEHGV